MAERFDLLEVLCVRVEEVGVLLLEIWFRVWGLGFGVWGLWFRV